MYCLDIVKGVQLLCLWQANRSSCCAHNVIEVYMLCLRNNCQDGIIASGLCCVAATAIAIAVMA